MCYTIVINKGEKEIDTPGQFLAYFGFEAPREWCFNDVRMDACLCQVDVKKALADHAIAFRDDGMSLHVTTTPNDPTR